MERRRTEPMAGGLPELSNGQRLEDDDADRWDGAGWATWRSLGADRRPQTPSHGYISRGLPADSEFESRPRRVGDSK